MKNGGTFLDILPAMSLKLTGLAFAIPTMTLPLLGGAIIFGILLIFFALSKSYPLSLILACTLGITSQFYITMINAILQVNSPDQLRGRVMGIYGLTWELMPVGGLIAGAIAEYAGAPAAVVVGGAFVAVMALGVAMFSPNMRRLEQ